MQQHIFNYQDGDFCQVALQLQNQDFIRAERQSGNDLSDRELTHSLTGLFFHHSF